MDLPTTASRLGASRRLLLGLLMVAGAAVLLFASGCDVDGGPTSFVIPVTLLERGGGSTAIVLSPTSSEDLGNGSIHYVGTAQAVLAGDPEAGRESVTIDGMADATINNATGERTFVFTATDNTDLGWSGLSAGQASIVGSGPSDGGTAALSSVATLDGGRAASWGFSNPQVSVAANLAADSPIFAVSADGGSAGNPLAAVGAPSPGGLDMTAQGMAVIFAPIAGESPLGQVSQGRWIRFVMPGSTPLDQGALLSWNTATGSLTGGGAAGNVSVAGSNVIATVEITASANSAYVSLNGPTETPQLFVMTEAAGTFWTDPSCDTCSDLTYTGHDVSLSTVHLPTVQAYQETRGGSQSAMRVTATGVNGSLGPVTISTGTLSADLSDPANFIADLNVTGSVLGVPVSTTFHGPFSFDLAQGQVDLTGALHLDLGGKVLLDGNLHVGVGSGGVGVTYSGGLALPTYGGNFTVNGNATYDLTQKTFNLGVDATGTVGPVSVRGISLQLNLTQAQSGGVSVGGNLAVGSISAGQAGLSNLKIGLSGNTSTSLTATINSSTDRVRLTLGSTADMTAYGSLVYTPATNALAFTLNFDGRVGSWQANGGNATVTWPGSGPVSGAISIGRVSNGQVTIANGVVDFSASSSAVTANLRQTTLTIGSMVSANISGSATYNVSNNTFSLNLSASGRVGSWTVNGVSAVINWPGSGSITGSVTVGQVTNGQVNIANAVIDLTASQSSVSATLRPTSVTASSLVSATVSGTATYSTATSTMTLTLNASGRVGPVNVNSVAANIVWPQSGNVTGSVSVGTVGYGAASLTGTSINFSANASSLTASISSSLSVSDPFRLSIGLSGTATYNLSTNVLAVTVTTGSGTMWDKPISGSITFNVNISGSTISGSASTSSLRFNYDKFGISLTSTTLNFSVANGTATVSGGGNVSVNGPMGNGWLSGSGGFTVAGNVLRSTNYHITLNNMNKTITWVDVGPRNGAPLSVDIIAGSLSYDAQGKMTARVDTGFPFYCEDLEFNIHAWGDQNVLRVDFEGSYVIGLFGAAGHMDVYDWLSSSNPPMYGYADVRITFFWFRYQTWNGQSLDNGSC